MFKTVRLKRVVSAVLAASLILTSLPLTAFASEEDDVPTLGYARKSQYVLYSSGTNGIQLNTTKTTLNGNLYSGGDLNAYSGEVDVRGKTILGGALHKHDYTVWSSYIFEDNADARFLTDFTNEVTASLGEEFTTHEYWQTYSDTDVTNTGNIYAQNGLQFCGNNVTLGGTIMSENYLMISASHALGTADGGEMNLYVANGNIGIYVGGAVINGVIFAPNGTVQICGSNVEINGMIIAKEIQISAQNVVINENLNLSLAQYVKCYNDQILAANASYDLENALFNIELYSTLEGGSYDIFTSADGESYELNGTTTESSYSFGINEPVEQLYIKATQTFENGFSLNSNVVKMLADKDCGYICEQTDTDGEGLIDLYEHIYGSDINNADTDGDGLTNLQEIAYGTDLTLADTDGDGLSDYDEIFVYGTDPLLPDTDGDGINDGDEIALGLNPLSADSNGDGCPDNEEISTQTVTSENLTSFNSDNAYTLGITIDAAGYANNSARAEESGFNYISQTNPAVIGKVAEISYAQGLRIDSAALTFTIPAEAIGSQRNFPDSLELAGIHRYAVFTYSTDYNVMYPVAVDYDEESLTMTVNTDKLGDFFIVDLDKWFFDMGIVPDEPSESEASALTLDLSNEVCYTEGEDSGEEIVAEALEVASSSRSALAAEKIQPVDVVFIVDCTDNLHDNFDNVKANIISAGEEVFAMCGNARICVISFWASATPSCGSGSIWATNLSQLETRVNSLVQRNDIGNSLHGAALERAASLSYRAAAEKFGFLIFDEYSQWSADMTGEMIAAGIQKVVNSGLNFSILHNPKTTLCTTLTGLISDTDGYDGTNQGNFCVDVAKHIYDNTAKVPEVTEPEEPDVPSPTLNCVDVSGKVMMSDFTAVPFIYDEITNPDDAKIKIGFFIDSDSDGLYDYEEVDWSNLYSPRARVYECQSYYDWVAEHFPRSIGSITWLECVKSIKILPILSNPWKADSDGDEINDTDDLYPLRKYKQKDVSWRTYQDAGFSDFIANMSYTYNAALDMPYESFITGQTYNKIRSMLFGGAQVGNTGCGVIAIYNAALLLGKPKYLSQIIYEFDLNPSSKTASALVGLKPLNGFFGASPLGIENYLSYHGFKYETTTDFDEFSSWAAPGRIFILLKINDRNDISEGFHYVMIQSDDKGTYSTYNLYSKDSSARKEVNITTKIIEDGAFLYGFYIQRTGGAL